MEQTTPQTPGSVTPTPPPVPVKSQPKTNPLLLFLLLLLLLTTGALAYQNYQLKNQQPTPPTTSPAPINTLSPTPLATPTPTPTWKTLNSTTFPVTLSYPQSWQYYPSADNDDLNLPYVRAFPEENETLADGTGCALHTGRGGGSQGPSEDITNETVTLDTIPFTKRTWEIDSQPVFIAYLPNLRIRDFEYFWAWVSPENSSSCLETLDQIVSSVNFTD